MKSYIRAVSVFVSAVCSTAAHAEVFNGVYAGGIVGYDKFSVEVTSGTVTDSASGDGVSGGALLGYNAKLGENFVAGIEAEGVIGGGKITEGTVSVKSDYTLSISARAGFLVSSNVLLFGKLGYAYTGISTDDGIDSESDSGDGVASGGGVEAAFTDRISGRIVYTRTSYSVNDDAVAFSGVDDVNINRDQVMAGVTFHF